MSLFYRIAICIAVATPVSALYTGFRETGGIAYTFDSLAALAFVATGIACVLLSGLQLPSLKTITKPGLAGKARRETGVVKWFNNGKGFGFITRDNGEEIFVHFRSLTKGSRRLAPGKNVEFNVEQGEKGPEAVDVDVL